jgi:hypothetical protein
MWNGGSTLIIEKSFDLASVATYKKGARKCGECGREETDTRQADTRQADT